MCLQNDGKIHAVGKQSETVDKSVLKMVVLYSAFKLFCNKYAPFKIVKRLRDTEFLQTANTDGNGKEQDFML